MRRIGQIKWQKKNQVISAYLKTHKRWTPSLQRSYVLGSDIYICTAYKEDEQTMNCGCCPDLDIEIRI